LRRCGSKEKRYPLRASKALIVDDLAATEKFLVGAGAVITKQTGNRDGPKSICPHPDGSVLEYVEWSQNFGCASSAESAIINEI